jgi:hypothetical protein
MQLKDSTASSVGNSRTEMYIYAYNGKWRYLSDAITFSWRFNDDDSFFTVFGG